MLMSCGTRYTRGYCSSSCKVFRSAAIEELIVITTVRICVKGQTWLSIDRDLGIRSIALFNSVQCVEVKSGLYGTCLTFAVFITLCRLSLPSNNHHKPKI